MWRGLQRRKGQNVSDRRHIWVPHSKSFTGWRGISQNLTSEKDVPAPSCRTVRQSRDSNELFPDAGR